MSPSAPRSRAARLGLLALAILHLVATAALPFTHVHEVRAAAVSVSSPDSQDDGGSAAGHPDGCSICRTLASAQTQTPATILIAVPFASAVVTARTDDADPSAVLLTTSGPRAPPRA